MSAVSTTTTSGAAWGDHSAGEVHGLASGGVGKAQPPSPGQTLLFGLGAYRILGDQSLCLGIILQIVGIALEKLLRKVSVIVVYVSLCYIRRAPRCFTRHIRSPQVQVKPLRISI